MTHARLGPSAAERWIACPGSIRLQGDRKSTAGFAAEQGTAAHAAAEHCLRVGCNASDLVGRTFGVIGITDDMAEHIQVYVDLVRREARNGELLIEQRVDLGELGPPEELFGTADAIVLHKRRLTVVDFKTGVIPVEVQRNPQLRTYAVGALLSVARPIEFVDILVCQPRAPHPDGPIRREALRSSELKGWAQGLIAAAWRTQDANAPLVIGEHCRFCPAKPVCPAQRERAAQAAAEEFLPMPAPCGARIAGG